MIVVNRKHFSKLQISFNIYKYLKKSMEKDARRENTSNLNKNESHMKHVIAGSVFESIETITAFSRGRKFIFLSSTNDFILLKQKLEKHLKDIRTDKVAIDLLMPFSICFEYENWTLENWEDMSSVVKVRKIFFLSKNNEFLYNFYNSRIYLYLTFQNNNEIEYIYEVIDRMSSQTIFQVLKIYFSGCKYSSCSITAHSTKLNPSVPEVTISINGGGKKRINYNQRMQQFVCLGMNIFNIVSLSVHDRESKILLSTPVLTSSLISNLIDLNIRNTSATKIETISFLCKLKFNTMEISSPFPFDIYCVSLFIAFKSLVVTRYSFTSKEFCVFSAIITYYFRVEDNTRRLEYTILKFPDSNKKIVDIKEFALSLLKQT